MKDPERGLLGERHARGENPPARGDKNAECSRFSERNAEKTGRSAGLSTQYIGRNTRAENASANEAGSDRRAGRQILRSAAATSRATLVGGRLRGAVDGDCTRVRLDQMPQGPGAKRKSVRQASKPSHTRLTMRGYESAVASQGFDTPPFVSAFDAR